MALLPLLTLNLFSPIIYVFASDHYARIETTTPIYKSANALDNFDNIYCLAEETYFVKILGDYDKFYRIYYNNINGYIKKSDVKEVSTTPSTPYPTNINLTIGSNCNLRSTPTTKSTVNNIVCTLYSNTSGVFL